MCGAHLLSEVVGREVVEDEMDAVLKSFGGFWEGVATVHSTQQCVNVGCVKDGQWPLGGGEGMSGRGGDKGKEGKVGTRGEGDEGKVGTRGEGDEGKKGERGYLSTVEGDVNHVQ